jgi:hypothetical protein
MSLSLDHSQGTKTTPQLKNFYYRDHRHASPNRLNGTRGRTFHPLSPSQIQSTMNNINSIPQQDGSSVSTVGTDEDYHEHINNIHRINRSYPTSTGPIPLDNPTLSLAMFQNPIYQDSLRMNDLHEANAWVEAYDVKSKRNYWYNR